MSFGKKNITELSFKRLMRICATYYPSSISALQPLFYKTSGYCDLTDDAHVFDAFDIF